MPADHPTILATSGGYRPGTRTRLELGPLVHHAVELSGAAGRPRLVHLGTAGGDQRAFQAELTEAADLAGFALSHLNLFSMPTVEDVEGLLTGADVVWVGGGSVANLLAVWRVHDLEPVLRRAWQGGVVLAGVSAGSICWHTGGTTDSFGPDLRPVTNGLGFLPYANGVHHDSEERRRPVLRSLVADGTFGRTHCTDDGVGLVYGGASGTELLGAVTEVRGRSAWVVERDPADADSPAGAVVEERLEPVALPGAR